MTDEYPDVVDVVRDVVLAQLLGIIHPPGSLGRYGAAMDRVNAFRTKLSGSDLPLPTLRSEEALLRSVVDVVEELWDVHSQIDLSLTQAPPTLGVLMERDAILASLALASEWAIEVSKSLAVAYASEVPEGDEDEDEDGPLQAALSRLFNKSKAPRGLEQLVADILGDTRMLDESAATLARVVVTNNPWYITVACSLATSLGTVLTPPAGLNSAVADWTP